MAAKETEYEMILIFSDEDSESYSLDSLNNTNTSLSESLDYEYDLAIGQHDDGTGLDLVGNNTYDNEEGVFNEDSFYIGSDQDLQNGEEYDPSYEYRDNYEGNFDGFEYGDNEGQFDEFEGFDEYECRVCEQPEFTESMEEIYEEYGVEWIDDLQEQNDEYMMERASFVDETSYEMMPTEARVSEVTSTGLVRIIFTRDVLLTDAFSLFIAENQDFRVLA